MRLPRVALFDLDDTIIEFEQHALPSWRAVAERFSRRLGGTDPAKLVEAIQARSRDFWADPERSRVGRLDMDWARRQVLGEVLGAVDGADAGLIAEVSAEYDRIRMEPVRPFPGAIETLEDLKSRGLGLGLITNGSGRDQREKVERFDLERLFQVIVIEGEFGSGKPDHRNFRHALEHLGSGPADAWMVGDRLEADIVPAVELGMHAVWVDWSARGLPEDAPARPHRTVKRIAELLEG